MSMAMELTGFLLCLASWLLTGSSLANDYWKISSVSGSVIISTRQYQNLFRSCAENSGGIRSCKDFESLLALPAYIQACRALMIIALLLGLVSIIVSVLGLKCTKIGRTSEQAKGKIVLTGGSLFILSGLSTLSAVSWYAAQVVREFHDPFFAGVRFELGAGLYMGWGAAFLAILGGAMLCSSCKKGSSVTPPRGTTYNYSKTTHGQQIYTAAPVTESGSSKAYV
ncbi:claudin 15-like b isoform X2 [Esox lucius]|uniref:Claudin n=1 Tax=Esox lucius TaxID=8010 RepID=A0AAY5K7V8_ESOLU|nr:claudin 15-like b isoform X2 [Esox lucius]